MQSNPTAQGSCLPPCDDPSCQPGLSTDRHSTLTMRTSLHLESSDERMSHSRTLGEARGSGEGNHEEPAGDAAPCGPVDRALPKANEALLHLGLSSSPFALLGKIGRCHANITIDSGASLNFVSSAFIHKHRMKTTSIKNGPIVMMADGTKHPCEEIMTKMSLKIGPYQETVERFHVLPLHPKYDIILGKPWLEAANPCIDWQANTMALKNRGHMVTLEANYDYRQRPESAQGENGAELMSAYELYRSYENGDVIHLATLTEVPGVTENKLAEQYQQKLDELLQEFSDVFPEELPPGIPPDREGHVHHIDLEAGSTPPSRPTYRLSFEELAELKKQLGDLLEKGFIQPSSSPYGAPILFVKKKDGKLRLCVDYRALNKITVKNKCPLPRIDELLDRLQGAKYFTSLDLKSGYHQIRVAPEDISKTAFRTRYGHFEFTVLPFGLCNAPGTFQSLMSEIFREYTDEFVLVYLDDIMIYSKSLPEHLDHLKSVLRVLRRHKLYAASAKCRFCQTRLLWLGHILSGDGIAVDQSKVQVVKDWPVPQDLKQLMSFLGTAGYYRRFMANYSTIAAPLTELTRKGVAFRWEQEQDRAFNTLKSLLTEAPVLAIANPDYPFVLHTDSSGVAIGGVLMQDQGEGLRPIAYFSTKLNKAQKNYPVHEQELLALVHALKTWRHYLLGAHKSVAYTDHKALKYLQTQPNLNCRQARWLALLQEFDLYIDYLPGKSNVVADALSRRPGAAADHPAVEECGIITTVRSDPEWLAQLKVAYGEDAESEQILKAIHDGSTTSYEIQNGLILLTKDNRTRLFIPDAGGLRQNLISEHHDTYFSGHLGMDKTLEFITRNYWWPTLTKDVREYVRTCPRCITAKAANQKPIGLLQPLPIPTKKYECVTMDFVSHLGKTKAGYDSVLVVVDKLTKTLSLLPTTTEVTAPQAAQLFFNGVVRYHGLPRVIISDRDPRFTSGFWQSLYSLLGTKLAMSTAFHPETDGQSERAVRTVVDMLRCFASDHKQWDEQLSLVEFAYNNSVNPSTGFSPFYMLYSQDVESPATIPMAELREATANETASDFISTNQAIISKAREMLQHAQDRQTEYANRKRREYEFSVGDQVLLSTANLSLKDSAIKKLSPKWCGPFKIVHKINATAYKLQLPKKMRMHPVFHASLLKPYVASTKFSGRVTRPPPLLDIGPDVYLVEKILKRRVRSVGRAKQVEYLVLWQGYPEHEATWESASSLADSGAFVQAQMAQFGAQSSGYT